MDYSTIKRKLPEWVGKYRYVGIVLIVGIVLMLIPSREKSVEIEEDTLLTQETLTFEEQLAQILSTVSGAGKVKVMLSVMTGEEVLYQTDEDYAGSEDNDTWRKDTVTVSDAQRVENGLIKQKNPPTYQGAVVVCQGADSPSVRLAIVDAVSKITGLGTDKISIMKMK